ncbi:hypothetical protein ACWEQO_04985 [Streptomyces sp. NPDC004051]
MHGYRTGNATALLGVSADTVGRPADGGEPTVGRDGTGRRIIPGTALPAYVRQQHRAERNPVSPVSRRSQ